MNLSDEVLMAYADGELDTRARSEVEDAMAADPQVAQRVAQHKALRDRLRVGYDKVLEEPVPDRLLATARGRASSPERGADGGDTDRGTKRTDNVIPMRGKRGPAPSVPYWGAIAASFVVGALVWHFGAQLYSTAPVAERNGELLASGALDRALSNQLVKDQDAQATVQIGVSFRSKQGNFCRTFRLQGGGNLSGLACRQQDKWKLEMLAQSDSASAGQPEYRPAGSPLAPAIAQAVGQVIDGEPLDAAAEAQAKVDQWRTP